MNNLNYELGIHLFQVFFDKMNQITPPLKIDDNGEMLIGKVRVGQIIIPNDIFRGSLLEIGQYEKIMVFGVKSGPWMCIKFNSNKEGNKYEVEFKIASKSSWIVANNYIRANCWAAIEKMIDLGLIFEPVADEQIKELKVQLEKVL